MKTYANSYIYKTDFTNQTDLQIPTNTPRHRVQCKTNRYGWETQNEGSRTGRDLADKQQDLPEQQQKEFNSSK